MDGESPFEEATPSKPVSRGRDLDVFHIQASVMVLSLIDDAAETPHLIRNMEQWRPTGRSKNMTAERDMATMHGDGALLSNNPIKVN